MRDLPKRGYGQGLPRQAAGQKGGGTIEYLDQREKEIVSRDWRFRQFVKIPRLPQEMAQRIGRSMYLPNDV